MDKRNPAIDELARKGAEYLRERERASAKWYHTTRGNPLFRRYFWAFMLALSIANIMREGRELWRAVNQ